MGKLHQILESYRNVDFLLHSTIPSSPLTYVRREEQGIILERVFKYSCLYVI